MSTVVIRYDGTDITDDVVLATAKFSALVNGAPGTFSMQVRDDTYTWDFITGKEITLEVDSSLVWGGFLTRAAKTYPLPVQDLDVTPTRYWEMAGVDYNVLFTKRIIFKSSDPTGKLDFKYAVGTYDDDIINDLFDHYLDVSGDGLDSSGVERVDIVTLDIPGVTSGKGTLTNGYGSVANAGYTWKQRSTTSTRTRSSTTSTWTPRTPARTCPTRPRAATTSATPTSGSCTTARTSSTTCWSGAQPWDPTTWSFTEHRMRPASPTTAAGRAGSSAVVCFTRHRSTSSPTRT